MNIYTDPVSLSKEWTFDVFPYEKTVDLQAVAAENGLPLQDVIFRTPLTAAPDGRLVCEVPVESRPFRTLVEAPGRSPRMVELGWTARNAVQIPLPRSYGIPFHLTDDGQVLKGPCELVLEWKPKGLRFIPDGDSFTSGAIQGLSPIRASLKVGPSGEGRLPLDSEGSWEGLHFRLMVRRPNTRVFDFGILNADLLGPLPWRFELQPPTAEVQVLVEDEAGYPVDGAQILLELDTAKAIEKARNLRAIEPLGQPPSVRRFGITDLKGLFRARMLAGAPLSCTASLGSRKAQADVEYPLEAGSQHLVRIVLPLPGLLLAGLILDPEGSPPSRFEELLVTATALETDYSRSTHPTVDGSFRFQELPAGVYQVSVADSVTDLAETIASAGDEAVELQMSATGIFELRLIDAVTGAPIERGAMAFYDEEGWDFINFKPGRVQHAMPAYWAVGIEVEGYAFSWLDLRPYYGMRRALETVALERGRTVSFSLTAMDGTPLSEVPELYLSVAGFRWFQALSTATSESGGTVLMWKTAPLEPCFVELKLKDGTTHMVKVPSGNQRIVPVRF